MDQKRKILLIDNSPDRKKRISLLKEHGFAVYPALSMEEARSRCKPGAYDLIIVNAGQERDVAVEFCDAIRERAPKQHLLLAAGDGGTANREYAVGDDPEHLLKQVKDLLQSHGAGDGFASAA